jgi:capsular polysaccharide biosynthesis protein
MVETHTDSPGVPAERAIRESVAQRLFRTLRERWPIIVTAVVAAVAAALVYVSFTGPTYQAQANLLISPSSDPNLNVLPLFRTSSEPTRDTQTAALLLDTPASAAQAARLLKLSESPQAILQRVQVAPVAGSDVVAVTGSASTPEGAALLANAFARGAIDVLTARLQAQLRSAIPRLRAQIRHSPQSGQASSVESLTSQLAALQALLGAPDPTVQLESAARAPSAPASPRKARSLGAAGLLGLVLGVLVALGVDAVDPRLRREAQLHDVLNLPVLARLPPLPDGPRRPSTVGRGEDKARLVAHELLAEAVAARGIDEASADKKRTIVFTPADPRTECTAITVAQTWLVASWGERVTLADGDPREPAVARATSAKPSPGSEGVLRGDDPLHYGLVPVELGGVEIRVLALGRLPRGFRIQTPRGHEMISQLLSDADVLVIDAPCLTDSVPAMLLARSANAVVVVARIGATRLDELRKLGELLSSQEVRGTGIVLVDAPARSAGRGRDRQPRALPAFVRSAARPFGSTPRSAPRR